MRQSLKGQMVADVPLGAFLSGGIDSSTVVALMQTMSARPVRTFTIGFDEPGLRRGPARQGRGAPSRHRPHRALRDVRRRRWPSSRSCRRSTASRSPTSRRSRPSSSRKLARGHVTVALSGDGGDELFSGYTRYRLGRPALAAAVASVPRHRRYARCQALHSAFLPARWDRAAAGPAATAARAHAAAACRRQAAQGRQRHRLCDSCGRGLSGADLALAAARGRRDRG